MEDFDMFYHPQLGWIDIDREQAVSIGIEFYINQLHSMGFEAAMTKSGKPKKLTEVLADFPFEPGDLLVFVALLGDGWKRLSLKQAEELGCSFFMNSKVGRVCPLEKQFGNAKCIFDFKGFNWFLADRKSLYDSPLPF